MRVDSVQATRKKIAAVPARATTGLGECKSTCSHPPEAIACAFRWVRKYTAVGIVPDGGFVWLRGSAEEAGNQLNVPWMICWLTPAAMNREIPEPIPHFETISSIRKTR